MRKLIIVSTVIVAALYLMIAGLLYVFQRNLLYIEAPEYQHNLTTIALENEGETLEILVLNPGKPHAIIYFGGNAEPVIFNHKPFDEHFRSHTVYLVNYRGYGASSGVPTEAGLYSDAVALYDRIVTQHSAVALIGRSLGSGVATYLASKRPVDQLALITPYDSIKNIVQQRLRVFPMSFLLLDKYDSVGRAGSITANVLIIMAELDSIIPRSNTIKLLDAFEPDQVQAVNIIGANHNNLSARTEYFMKLKAFFETRH